MKLLTTTGMIMLLCVLSVATANAQTPDATNEENAAARETASARGLAQIDLEPIEDDSSYSLRKKRPRNKFLGLVHLSPYGGYLSTGWKGVTATAPSVYPYSNGTGGDITARDGYAAGMGVLVGNSMFQFESGLRYANRTVVYKGYLKDTNQNPMPYTGNITEEVSYVEVPLLARFNFPEPSESHFFVHGGVVSAIVTNRASNIDSLAYNWNSGYVMYTANPSATGTLGDLNSFDFRGLAGIGGELKISPTMGITVIGDYERSFGKINSSGQDSLSLQGFAVYAGITFDL